ncbi:hypothetical protein [Gemmobacter denitrificans]|uniref:Uncharacterized protein n=1 Tax=Gemmobacter denitrificans TaxID=3123040 RepID=A0ABU8BZB7_9RHOB
MQLFRPEDHDAALVGWGVRVLLLAETGSRAAEAVSMRIAGFGGLPEAQGEMFAALETLIDDPAGYGLFVMDCETFGGLDAGRRAFAILRAAGCQVPVILVSTECSTQSFPDDRSAPILLRSPLSAVSMRVGFEHALRERMMWQAA